MPKNCGGRIIILYHSSISAGYQGVNKMYLAINEQFFIPDLMCYLKAYIKGCHIDQLHRNEKPSRDSYNEG